MKNIIVLLLSVLIVSCGIRKRTLEFVTLNKTDFSSQFTSIPNNKITDSLKQAHDSCMGFSFHANAMLIGRDNPFSVGTIVNRRTLKVVNTLNDLQLTQSQMVSQFNVLTNPCYEKRVLQIPLKQLTGNSFVFHFPDFDDALNKEVNDAITASNNAEMQTGSWVYLDIKDALRSILDTVKSPVGLHYKSNLLDSANMVVTSVESVTDVSFLISTQKDLSERLQTILKSKPSVSQPGSGSSMRLSYIDNNQFEITLDGFFPVVGEFMRAEL